MEYSGKSDSEIVGMLIDEEIEGVRDYDKVAMNAECPILRNLAKQIAIDERKHVTMLTNWLTDKVHQVITKA